MGTAASLPGGSTPKAAAGAGTQLLLHRGGGEGRGEGRGRGRAGGRGGRLGTGRGHLMRLPYRAEQGSAGRHEQPAFASFPSQPLPRPGAPRTSVFTLPEQTHSTAAWTQSSPWYYWPACAKSLTEAAVTWPWRPVPKGRRRGRARLSAPLGQPLAEDRNRHDPLLMGEKGQGLLPKPQVCSEAVPSLLGLRPVWGRRRARTIRVTGRPGWASFILLLSLTCYWEGHVCGNACLRGNGRFYSCSHLNSES